MLTTRSHTVLEEPMPRWRGDGNGLELDGPAGMVEGRSTTVPESMPRRGPVGVRHRSRHRMRPAYERPRPAGRGLHRRVHHPLNRRPWFAPLMPRACWSVGGLAARPGREQPASPLSGWAVQAWLMPPSRGGEGRCPRPRYAMAHLRCTTRPVLPCRAVVPDHRAPRRCVEDQPGSITPRPSTQSMLRARTSKLSTPSVAVSKSPGGRCGRWRLVPHRSPQQPPSLRTLGADGRPPPVAAAALSGRPVAAEEKEVL